MENEYSYTNYSIKNKNNAVIITREMVKKAVAIYLAKGGVITVLRPVPDPSYENFNFFRPAVFGYPQS